MADYYMNSEGKLVRKEKKKADYTMKDGKLVPNNVEAEVVAPSQSENSNKMEFFQKGAFENGYQFGDGVKSVLGTAADIGIGIGKGALNLVEGLGDLAQYGVAGVAGLFGADKFADDVKKSAQKNFVNDTFKGVDDYLDKYSFLGDTSDAITQGVGQVGGMILTGGLGSAAGLGTLGTTALTSGMMGLSGMGSGMSEAYQGGASDGEALAYGAMKGVVDAGTEMIFGGLGKAVNAVGLSRGITSLDDAFARKLSSKISNQAIKNLTQFGVKASAEGVEEVLAGLGTAAAKKLTYMSEEDLGKLVKDERLLEQFVVGTVTSGLMQSGAIPGTRNGSLIEANKQKRDFVQENTQDAPDKASGLFVAPENEQTSISEGAQGNAQETASNALPLVKEAAQNQFGNTTQANDAVAQNVDELPDGVHTADQLRVIEEYKNTSDERIIDFLNNVRSNPSAYIKPMEITKMNDAVAEYVLEKTGIDTHGNNLVLRKDVVGSHLGEHFTGVDGKSPMSDGDLSKIKWVIDNADEVAITGKVSNATRTKEGKPAPHIMLRKRIDGHYYVVEAVTDGKSKNNVILSAFIEEAGKERGGVAKIFKDPYRVPNAFDDNSSNPSADVRNVHELESSKDSIPNSPEKVNLADENNQEVFPLVKEASKITKEITDSARARELKGMQLQVATYNPDTLKQYNNVDELENAIKSEAEKIIKPIAEKLGVFKQYNNDDIQIEFEFSRNSMRESTNAQATSIIHFN